MLETFRFETSYWATLDWESSILNRTSEAGVRVTLSDTFVVIL